MNVTSEANIELFKRMIQEGMGYIPDTDHRQDTDAEASEQLLKT